MSEYPLFEKLIDYRGLKRSYKQTQLSSRKYRKEAILFDMARERNLVKIWRELKNETYLPCGYIEFHVYNPKKRLIHAPKIRDKVVQYAAHKILRECYGPVFINDSYACLEEKGSHMAAKQVQHFLRMCQWKHGTGWILKLDIKKYFYSIDRDILKQLLRKKISDEKFLRVLDVTIDSSPEGDKGIPLGCATSQDFANIYLNEVDQLCKRYLSVKWYVRYMDDMVMVFETKEQAQAVRDKVIQFIQERLNLEPNDKKTKIFPIDQGVNAYGYKIYATHMLIRESSKRAMKRRIRAMDEKQKNGVIKKQEVQNAVNSWLGHARHSNSFVLAKKMFERYPYIKIEHPDFYFGKKPKKKKAKAPK